MGQTQGALQITLADSLRHIIAHKDSLLEAAGELLAPLPEAQRAGLATALEQLRVLLPSPKR